MKKIIFTTLIFALAFAGCNTQKKDNAAFELNDKEYFERQGVNVLIYSNTFNGGFNDEKNSGIEIIHHGVRTVQGGAIRLNNTPEQWDLVPKTTERKINKDDKSIEVTLRYEDYDFDSRIVAQAKGNAVEISVYLDKPVPEALAGTAGFNLEFLPSQYWSKMFLADNRPGLLPKYAASNTVVRDNSQKPKQFKGFKTYDDRGTNKFVDPLPLETAHTFVMASDDPERLIKISSADNEISLYDGRMIAQNGWYVLRSVLTSGKTGKVISWTVEPNAINGWIRKPNIGFSQVGYVPDQIKTAVIEIDKNDKILPTASLYKIDGNAQEKKVFEGKTQVWGDYFKYNYAKFDFSQIKEPGVYYIQYGQTKTEHFIINQNVYDKITDATSDIWIPIHMNHITVNEGYRIWHGEPFKEGYIQAPPSDHFDLHHQGETTDTKYKPYELIPGLNIGGFFDAGDFDIETGSNISVVQNLVRTWELFRSERDETFVDEKQRYVDLHRPDGVPDILQYIEHGVLNLVAQAENIGHMASTLSNGVLDNYHHLGDAASITDGLHYDPKLPPYTKSADGKSSGTKDDMWAFTTRNPMLDNRAATMFAAASRVLKGYNDQLADRALVQSKRLFKEAQELIEQRRNNNPRFTSGEHDELSLRGFGNVAADIQLYAATREQQYLDNFEQKIWKALDFNVNFTIQTALDAIAYMPKDYKEKLRPYIQKYKVYLDSLDIMNPYGIPIGLGNWAGGGATVMHGTTVCYAHKYYPDIIGKEYAYKTAAFLFGCHPYHNYSLVATVGATRPKAVFYGNNRADFSFIPGNMAPGILFRKPDHFENYDDWPFLWGQNEGTIAGNTGYLIFGLAFKEIINN